MKKVYLVNSNIYPSEIFSSMNKAMQFKDYLVENCILEEETASGTMNKISFEYKGNRFINITTMEVNNFKL